MQIGFFQPGTIYGFCNYPRLRGRFGFNTWVDSFKNFPKSGIFLQIIGSLKTTPPIMLRMVPFGDRHICFKPNSSTRSSSGVMVAHFTATLCSKVAKAESIVT